MAENTKEIRVLIVEDEAPTRELLTKYCLSREEFKLSDIAKDGEEALTLLQEGNIDLVFLDINLPHLTGIEVLQKLEVIPYVIFVTSLRDKAIDAFELGAIDYLLKPFSKDRFQLACEKAIKQIRPIQAEEKDSSDFQSNSHGLFILEKENYFLIPFQDIIYISSRDNFSVIHTEEREFVTYKSLKTLETKLPSPRFLRIFKQFIINLEFLSHLHSDNNGNYLVYLKDEDETQLPVGRKYIAKIKELL